MKWLLAVGILAVAVAVLGMGTVGLGMAHYCMPTHGFTPMICKTPIPPGMPIPHPNYH
jgi:hypothetical protein